MSNAETQELFAVEGLVDGKWVAQWPICDSEEGARATFGMYGEGAQLRVARFVREEAQLANTEQSAPVAQGDALTYEQSYAIRQGHEIASSDAYFEARPQIDNNDRRSVFRAGFDRGWDAARAQAKEGGV